MTYPEIEHLATTRPSPQLEREWHNVLLYIYISVPLTVRFCLCIYMHTLFLYVGTAVSSPNLANTRRREKTAGERSRIFWLIYKCVYRSRIYIFGGERERERERKRKRPMPIGRVPFFFLVRLLDKDEKQISAWWERERENDEQIMITERE